MVSDYSSPEGNVHISCLHFLGVQSAILEDGLLKFRKKRGFVCLYFCFCIVTYQLWQTSAMLGAVSSMQPALPHSVLTTTPSSTNMNLRLGSRTQACLAPSLCLRIFLSSLLELLEHGVPILTWQRHVFTEQNLPLLGVR